MAPRLAKPDRHRRLKESLEADPFITDRELARLFQVSVQTVRLDRLELGIPESRERTRRLAEEATNKVRSVTTGEVIGELIHVSLGEDAMSMLETTLDMAFRRTGIVRGHHIFAQANSLAVALVDAEGALTGTADVRFLRPVKAGERLTAKATVIRRAGRKYYVDVVSRVSGKDVFEGKFVVFAMGPTKEGEGVKGEISLEDRT